MEKVVIMANLKLQINSNNPFYHHFVFDSRSLKQYQQTKFTFSRIFCLTIARLPFVIVTFLNKADRIFKIHFQKVT